MRKKKSMVLGIMLAAPAVWALASILSFASAPVAVPAIPNQVNVFELLSTAKDLPMQTYDAF